ncbi:glycoside hydrolase family 1 protein [Streptacidiphilus jiangxiensis]|uniref:6-phospho-beta-glucosidase n=1 Tax=Streptacidiphilus jiangxiensis TaxID=235985 RepID=A0A1H7X098_STRJI|nr:glycoside hydrolase family 1 protein [Streptacidiphilus jiangxiensis]SEM26627.1 6-phospho-beta-glucosidase [Streptacidiphilus jiangxiensis]
MQHRQLAPFSPDFLWGASTSAYQVEGAWDADGKGRSVQDARTNFPEGTTDYRVAADHYHRFAEDVELFAELGLTAYRFSVAWTRIVPDGDGEVNREGVAFYHRLIDALLERGIEPVLTMYHFDLPQALHEKGGWGSRATVDAFTRYARILFEEFGSKVRYWLTINEQNMMILHGAAIGTAGDAANPQKALYQQNHHMMLAQAETMRLCHELVPGGKIGPAPNISVVYPASPRPEDILAAEDFNAIRNWLYLDMACRGSYNPTAWAWLTEKGIAPEIADSDLEILASGRPDFLALNYYSTATVAAPLDGGGVGAVDGADQQLAVGEEGVFRSVRNEHLPVNAFGWEIDPVGFRTTLRVVHDRYRLPLLVTENGLGAFDTLEADGSVHDPYRIEYLAAHISQMRAAVSDGVEMLGYCPWSAIDLISTHQGVRKRYGFVYVDRDEFDLKELKRYRKDSFFWYQQLIKSDGSEVSAA